MTFYRLATEKDFQKAEADFDRRIPLAVRFAFNQHDIKSAITCWRETGFANIQDILKELDAYAAFRLARDDFSAGKPVYTAY